MGKGTCGATVEARVAYTDFVDPNKKWYNNNRCVPSNLKSCPALRQCPFKASLSSTSGLCFCNYLTYILSCQLKALNIDSLRLISSLSNSYDGNIVYSFQALPQWMRYFHNPAGTGLTLLNSMQVSIYIKLNAYEFLPSIPADLWVLRCTSHDSLCSGWSGTTHFHFHWCIGIMCCHRHSDCGQLPGHVHRCSVCLLFHSYYCLCKEL